MAKRVDFVCDSYKDEPSIKDAEHDFRMTANQDSVYTVSGPNQKWPKNFHSLLSLPQYKRELLYFLADEWQKSEYADIIMGHDFYVGLEENSWLYIPHADYIERRPVPDLVCEHQEADTRLLWHVNHMGKTIPDQNVVVRCNDTDVLIIFLLHSSMLPVHVWLEAGLTYNNSRCFIDVNHLAEYLGPDICNVLPGLHAFTGCDYTAAFLGKGKLRPMAIMKKPEFIRTFIELETNEVISPEVVDGLNAFVCCMYGKPNLTSVNKARLASFQQHYAPKSTSQPLEKMKGIDPSHLPPCASVLYQKIKRTNLVVAMWRNAGRAKPNLMDPVKHGWIKEQSRYKLQWYEGLCVPEVVIGYITEDDDQPQQISDNDDQDWSSGDESEFDKD